jgi:hypothetical protein
MSHQIVSWLRNTVEVLSLITDNRHLFRRIVWDTLGHQLSPGSTHLCLAAVLARLPAWEAFGLQVGSPTFDHTRLCKDEPAVTHVPSCN